MSVAEGTEEDKGPSAKEGEAVPVVKMSDVEDKKVENTPNEVATTSSSPQVQKAKLILKVQPEENLIQSKNDGKAVFYPGGDGKPSFLMGRSQDAGCVIVHVGASRRHATLTFRQDDGAASATRGVWSLTHHKTMNGIMVNGKGVEKESSVDLSDGDLINIQDQFSWKFEFPVKPSKSSVEMEMKEALRDLAKEKLEADQRVKESVVKQIELKAKNEALESKLDDERRAYAQKQDDEREAFEAKLNATKEEITKEQRAELEATKAEFEAKQAQERKAMEAKQAETLEQMKQAEKRMAEEVLQREEKIRHIEIDRAKLESEKLQLESEYKTEIAKLEERSKADMERMAREHEDQMKQRAEEEEQRAVAAQEVFKFKESELQKKDEDLEKHKAEIAKLKEENSKRKGEELADSSKRRKTEFYETASNELKCSICDELFIEPLTLGQCGHVYCHHCIGQWERKCREKDKKKPVSCPECRADATNKTKAIQINNLIQSLYANADPALKAEREQIIRERKGEVKPKAVVAQDASETISISSDSDGSSSGSDDSDTDSDEERYY